MVTITPAHVAQEQLKSGNRRYRSSISSSRRTSDTRRITLAGGQDPFAAVLSCADSRVVPELLFDQQIGDLFTVRVAGNVANSSSIASLEYAVTALNVRLIVVMGHESCGAVSAALGTSPLGHHLEQLMRHVRPAVEGCSGDPLEASQRNARHAAGRLLASSTLLRETRDLVIAPAFYWLKTGKVSWLNPA